MFSFALPAAIAAIIAIIYLWLIAPLLLPRRETALDADSRLLLHVYCLENRCSRRMTVAEARAADSDVNIRRILREDAILIPLPDVILRPGDRSDCSTLQPICMLLQARSGANSTPVAYARTSNPFQQQTRWSRRAETGRTGGGARIKSRWHQPGRKSIHPAPSTGRSGIAPKARTCGEQTAKDLTLQTGDVLLVKVTMTLRAMKQSTELLLDHSITLPRTDKALPALIITAATILLAATGVLPIAIAAIAGTGLMLLTQCLTLGAAVRAISPAIYFVVAASLALGMALQATGATAY